MTKSIDEAKEVFNAKLKEYMEFYHQVDELDNRLSLAENNIVNLQQEREELREKRPVMLADNKDVSKINKRFRDIDDEIELNKDTVTGITTKRKEVYSKMKQTQQHANADFQEYINEILAKLKDDYMKIAPKFAELLKDYLALEAIRDGDGYKTTAFPSGCIKYLPNFNGNKPLFEYNFWQNYLSNSKRVLKKYDIPEFEVRRVSLNDF